MNYLLDTCALSETVRRRPDPRVLECLRRLPQADCYLSVLTLGEIRGGLTLLPESKRKQQLQAWLEEALPGDFRHRILPVTSEIALRWGETTAQAQSKGRILPAIDGLIAATAQEHRLVVVTRNVRHMKFSGVQVLNPWES
jgi:predicted nucleic acid-binding protein